MRRHLGIVPEELLDDEEKVRQWAREQVEDAVPRFVGLRVTKTLQNHDTESKITITVAEALCGEDGETIVTYCDLNSAEAPDEI